MLLTNHTLTGIALGLTIDDVEVLAPTAIASHFVLDSVPHFGDKCLSFDKPLGRIWAAIDCSVALTLAVASVFVFPHRFLHLFIGVVGATVPDLLYIPKYLFHKIFWKPLFDFHHIIQTERLWLFPVELIWAASMLTVINVYR